MRRLLFLCAIVFVTFTAGAGSANAQACGAEGARPCTIFERIPSCNQGLVENFALGRCVRPDPCGAAGQRPCSIFERIPSCNAGLVEDFIAGRCVRPTPCGGEGERPCTIIERIPSCDAGLVEDFAQNRCVRPTPCGGSLQRPCTIIERIPSCNAGLVEDFLAGLCLPPESSLSIPEMVAESEARLAEQAEVATLAAEFVTNLNSDHPAAQEARAALQAGDVAAAAQAAMAVPGFDPMSEEAYSEGYRTLTIGAVIDAQLVLGGNTEIGVAIALDGSRPVLGYNTSGFSVGVALGVDAGIAIGLYYPHNQDIAGPSQGVAMAVNYYVGVNHTGWFLYPAEGEEEPHFVGFTFAITVGIGVEIGEYNRVVTSIL